MVVVGDVVSSLQGGCWFFFLLFDEYPQCCERLSCFFCGVVGGVCPVGVPGELSPQYVSLHQYVQVVCQGSFADGLSRHGLHVFLYAGEGGGGGVDDEADYLHSH